MPKVTKYESASFVLLPELQEVLEAVKAGTVAFTAHWADLPHLVFLKHFRELPEFRETSGLEFTGIYPKGHLPLDQEWQESACVVIEQSRKVIGSIGVMTVWWLFNDKESVQKEGDHLQLCILPDKYEFKYDVYDSKAGMDEQYRQMVMTELISILHLPLVIKQRKGRLVIEHTAGGYLQTATSDDLARSFRCEVAIDNVNGFLQGTQQFLGKYASCLNFCYWYAFGFPDPKNPHASLFCVELYEAIRRNPFPAISFDVQIKVTLKTLEGAFQLLRYLGKEQIRDWPLAAFSPTKGDQHMMEMLLMHDGVKLLVKSKKSGEERALSKLLGVKMQPSKFRPQADL